MDKKTFVFDIDGTIIENNEPLNNPMENILKKLIVDGHTIIFATARSIRGVSFVLPDWCLQQLIIYCNGSFARKDNVLVYSNPISPDIVLSLIELIQKDDIPYYIELGDCYFQPENIKHNFYDVLYKEGPNERITNKNIIYIKPVYKIVILPGSNILELIDRVEKFTDYAKIYKHSDGTIDIVAKNCSKWTALSSILSKNEYSTDLISFGNDINDYELLNNSTFSIAINPQNQKLKKAANKIIPTYDFNAIEQAILAIC